MQLSALLYPAEVEVDSIWQQANVFDDFRAGRASRARTLLIYTMSNSNETLQDISNKLSMQKSRIDYLLFINPSNFASEKRKFFKAFYEGQAYNPKYKYKKTHELFRKEENYLFFVKKLLAKSKNGTTIDLIHTEIKDQLLRIQLIRSIGTPKVTVTSRKLFGAVDSVVVKKITAEIKGQQKLFPQDGELFTQSELLTYARDFFARHGFVGWRADINIPGGPSVCRSNDKLVLFQAKSSYNRHMVDILLAHEILGHAQQEENAQQQSIPLFISGFGLYEPLHEGFALWQESKINPKLETRISLYYLAVYKAERASFYQTFCYLLQWLSLDDAYILTSRVKRGLIDTGQPGTWYKDKLYYEGYEFIKKLNKTDKKIVARAKFDTRYFNDFKQLVT